MPQNYLIRCGKLFDGIHEELLESMEILVSGKIIREVGRNLAYPEGTEIIDLGHLTVTPGMMDAHIHSDLMTTTITDFGNIIGSILGSDAYHTLAHLHTAQESLKRGFTTIRCMNANGQDYGVVDAKRTIEQGYFSGARMVVAAHMLGAIGGHADYSTLFGMYQNPRLSELYRNKASIGAGADFFREAVQNEAKFGSDFIKIMLSGGFFTPNDGPEDQQLSDLELQTIIDTAKDCHKTVTAHVYTPELMKKLIRFGLDGAEHGAMMDEETAQMFEDSNIYLVPTMTPFNEIIWLDEENLAKKPVEMQQKLRTYNEKLKRGRQCIVDSNIRLGYGTDIVSAYDVYDSWIEYASWMKAGMNPFRILKAATSVNAEILQVDHITGSIVPGKCADIAAWHRDLLTDPLALKECDFVMKEGVVYDTVYAAPNISSIW